MYPDDHSIAAAVGYLRLGMINDAWDELESLPRELRAEDEAITLRIEIYHRLGKWRLARVLAESMAKRSPESPQWWIAWANSLRRETNTLEARWVLYQAIQALPASAPIIYNLACFTCCLGETKKARQLLERAFALDADLKTMALDDPDLVRIFGASGKLD